MRDAVLGEGQDVATAVILQHLAAAGPHTFYACMLPCCHLLLPRAPRFCTALACYYRLLRTVAVLVRRFWTFPLVLLDVLAGRSFGLRTGALTAAHARHVCH